MTDNVFPQVGDLPDAAFFSALIAAEVSGIISGLSLTPDFAVPEVTIQSGVAVITTGGETTQHPNIQPAETVQETSKIVDLDARTVALTDNAVNSIFVDVNVGTDDDPQVIATTTDTPPTPESLKIGEVDTSTNTTADQFNKLEADGVLSFPTATAASDALSSLPNGVVVLDRANALRLTANGALTNVGDPVTDFGVGTVADGEFLQNVNGSLTGVDRPGNVAAKGELTSVQSVAGGTVTQINLGNAAIEQASTVIEVDTAANQLIIKESGVYTVTANFTNDSFIRGSFTAFIVQDGTRIAVTRDQIGSNAVVADSLSAMIDVSSPNSVLTLELRFDDTTDIDRASLAAVKES